MHDVQRLADRDATLRSDAAEVRFLATHPLSQPQDSLPGFAGLTCLPQSLDAPFRDPAAPPPQEWAGQDKSLALQRSIAVVATLALTMIVMIGTAAIAPPDLPVAAMVLLMLFVAVAFAPIAQGAVLTTLGLFVRTDQGPGLGTRGNASPTAPLRVALLLPIHEEDPVLVFGNAAAMLDDLADLTSRNAPGTHEFALFILSDTRSAARIADEERALRILRRTSPPRIAIHYRRRAAPVDRKMGNIRDWMETQGADWPAMLVLDADSLMSGAAILQLTDALAADPSAGLIQSVPRIVGAQTTFARLQAFSHSAHGGPLAQGLAACAGNAGNYWGHNAILRTRAFAAAAGLPHLPPPFASLRGRTDAGDLILSHDFVEAALLRRAGWGVRIVPGIEESYEEAPPSLIDHALRDRRWCRGNMQHLRLLGTPGLHPVSRVHMAMGAIAYLAAPAWLGLILFWVACGFMAPGPATDQTSAAAMLGVTAVAIGALLLPRVVTLLPHGARRPHRALDILVALVLSSLYAPILMIQQSISVARAALGLRQGWAVQNRLSADLSVGYVARFHWVETVFGVALLAGIVAGLVSAWLLAVALPMALAVPLSLFAARPFHGMWTPEDATPPAILVQARQRRAAFANAEVDDAHLDGLAIAAE